MKRPDCPQLSVVKQWYAFANEAPPPKECPTKPTLVVSIMFGYVFAA